MADDTQKPEESREPEESKATAEVPANTSDGGSVSEAKADSSEVSKAEEATPEPAKQSLPSETEGKEEPKVEEPASPDASQGGPKKAPKPVSASLEKIIEQIEKLSVLELADLVHSLEDKFGVSAQAPVAVASTTAGPTAGGEPAEEKTTFNVVLTAGGANKIAVIKAVRELVQTLGLKEAKDLVEAAPKVVLESVNKTTAEEAKTKLTAAGATVTLE